MYWGLQFTYFLLNRPGPDMKAAMASSIIGEFPFLKDPAGNGDVSRQSARIYHHLKLMHMWKTFLWLSVS